MRPERKSPRPSPVRRLFQREEGEAVPLALMLPNLVTLTGMCLGLTAIRLVMDGRIKAAVVMILLAAMMDGLDGLIARRLNATSKLGAQLDSLSDFLCFGVAPAVLVYAIFLGSLGNLGWIAVLTFAGATCLRLARFNVMDETPEDKADALLPQDTPLRPHFTGVPAPAGAMLGLLPAFLTFAGIEWVEAWPEAIALWLGLVAVLMISTLRTISPKALRVPRHLIGPVMFMALVLVGLVLSHPWMVFSTLSAAYLALVTVDIIRARGRLFA